MWSDLVSTDYRRRKKEQGSYVAKPSFKLLKNLRHCGTFFNTFIVTKFWILTKSLLKLRNCVSFFPSMCRRIIELSRSDQFLKTIILVAQKTLNRKLIFKKSLFFIEFEKKDIYFRCKSHIPNVI